MQQLHQGPDSGTLEHAAWGTCCMLHAGPGISHAEFDSSLNPHKVSGCGARLLRAIFTLPTKKRHTLSCVRRRGFALLLLSLLCSTGSIIAGLMHLGEYAPRLHRVATWRKTCSLLAWLCMQLRCFRDRAVPSCHAAARRDTGAASCHLHAWYSAEPSKGESCLCILERHRPYFHVCSYLLACQKMWCSKVYSWSACVTNDILTSAGPAWMDTAHGMKFTLT